VTGEVELTEYERGTDSEDNSNSDDCGDGAPEEDNLGLDVGGDFDSDDGPFLMKMMLTATTTDHNRCTASSTAVS